MFYEEISGEILKKNAPAPEVTLPSRLLIRIQFNMVFCFGTNQKKFQALEFLPRLKSFLSRREKRTPDRRLLLNKNGLTFCSHSTMSNFRKFVLPRLLTKRPDPCNDP